MLKVNRLRGVEQDFENTLREACPREWIREKIKDYLKGEGRGIPLPRALGLIRFLNLIQCGKFNHLSTLEKKGVIENIFYLIQYKLQKEIVRLCTLFFEEPLPLKKYECFYPQTMVESLVSEALKETDENIQGMLWAFLMKKEFRLQLSVAPSQLVFALWARDPILRNNMIRFMITHFETDAILNAILVYLSRTGQKMPGIAFDRLLGFAREEEKLNQEKSILAGIIRNGRLSNTEIDQIWADYLRGRNRFELIKIFSVNRDMLNQIEGLKKKDPQLLFCFAFQKNDQGCNDQFCKRVNMIKSAYE